MSTVKRNIHEGQVIATELADFADETEVETMSPADIARTLAAMDEIEPLEMTDEELAAIEAHRQAHKEWEKARFNEHAEDVGSRGFLGRRGAS